MGQSTTSIVFILVLYCLIVNVSETSGTISGIESIDGSCFDDEVAICKEVSRACQITYDASGSRDFECACQYPFLERNGECIYEPESHHFKLKMELTNMYPLIDLNDVINYHRLKEDLKEWLKGIFPDATIHVTNIWKKRLSFTLLEEFSHVFKQTPKTKIYAEARLSQSGLSKHKIKQTLNNACSSICKTEMFSLVSPAKYAEIESLDSTECSVCGPTHICNPRASTLCSCKDNSTDCLDMPVPLRFQMVEETDLGDEFSAPDLLSGFGRSEELGRALKGFPKNLPPCPRYHQKLCQLINGDCVPSLSKGLSCECMENYVMSKTGTCTPIHEIEDDVYRAQLLLRNDAPWSEDLADKTSYRYLRLKRNALRFLKVVFPDARTSVLGFAPSNRRQRDSTGSQVQMEIVLVSNITEYDAETVSTRLQAYQVDDEVTVSGIAFSVYTEVYAKEDPCLNNDCLSQNQKCVPLSASDYKCVCGFPAIKETEDSDVFCNIVPTYDPYGGRVVIQLNSERDLTSDFTTDYIALRSEIEDNFDNDLFAKISHVSYFGLLETVSDLTLTVVFYINVQTDGTNPADISGLLEDIESRLGQQLHSTSYTMDLSTLEITKSLITCSTLNICAAGLDKYALCSNNATTNITQCTCSKGFREQYSICQDDDDCKGNPCANYGDNDAVCNDFYGYFKCNCSTGFIYANDDGCVPDPTLKNPCSPDPCDSDKSKCVKALNEVGYECKCFFPFVRRPDGSCSKTKPGKDKVYNITIPLTSLTVWTDDLSDPNSLAFLKLKKDAEKFIKAIFKDAVGQIQGFSKRPAATGRFFPSIPSPYRQQKSQKTYAFVELSVFDDSDCTDCDDSHECISESSSKKCICKPGMEQVGVNGNIAICEDVNECKDRNPCASYGDFGSKCINHDGRFLKYLCDCSPGYKFGRGSCIDKEVL